ncbi:hypothetical protein SAMD00079811_01070 [Scytonema sp. HK-05]|uniref:DUF2584 family protein n=1 Tax=Scytonema sp. HK-05 TaxID=1137095 RepID=UPI000936A0B0|nr:DUF2584 family protein [Scytonema sp. HK-05]OKH57378.1 DUF2584 domain-containing protein [Scytonema sp. HK-05]BAY42530.1 hypothetical protein SAMD00079811_01070 [Scytonema sp. HK-05]
MGMPCEINNILKLNPSQGYPKQLIIKSQHQVSKNGYRIVSVDVPVPLVDENWVAHADVIIRRLIWEKGETIVIFEIDRIYELPFSVKVTDAQLQVI